MRSRFFAWFVCSSWQVATAAEESCPRGPFETDRAKIGAALTSLPTLRKSFGSESQSSTKPEAWTLTDALRAKAAVAWRRQYARARRSAYRLAWSTTRKATLLDM
jgi:hypothetical protein